MARSRPFVCVLVLLVVSCGESPTPVDGGQRPGAPQGVAPDTMVSTGSDSGTEQQESSPAGTDGSAIPPLPADDEIAAWRTKYLRLAFDGFSGMPDVPHEKNRSRGQRVVVEECLNLGQRNLALELTREITNWQRGLGFAGIAEQLARNGSDYDSSTLLTLAQRAALSAMQEQNPQEWRRDRVFARIASTHILLGEPEKAAPYVRGGLEPSERARLLETRARTLSNEKLGDLYTEIEALIATGELESIQASLAALGMLYERSRDDSGRREQLEAQVFSAIQNMPTEVQLGAIERLLIEAHRAGDEKATRRLFDRFTAMRAAIYWKPLDDVRLHGRVAWLQFLIGDEADARATLLAGLARYDELESRIQNFERSDALLPLAATYAEYGMKTDALALIDRCITLASVNPNARVRADDFSAILTTLVRVDLKPTAELDARLEKARRSLRAPW